MQLTIEWDPKEEVVSISEENGTGEEYHVSGNWPAVIDDVCLCLRDYLEGMDQRNE